MAIRPKIGVVQAQTHAGPLPCAQFRATCSTMQERKACVSLPQMEAFVGKAALNYSCSNNAPVCDEGTIHARIKTIVSEHRNLYDAFNDLAHL